MDRLEALVALTLQWTQKINLISKTSAQDIWTRHISDSLQLVPLAPRCEIWADLGSGGGYPALVLACHFLEYSPDTRFVLVESDQRKCAFLRTAIQNLSLNAQVMAKRIEDIPALNADVLSARALTALPGLLAYCESHLKPKGTALFPKGENFQDEVAESLDSWTFAREIHPSLTNSNAAILKLWDIKRA